MASASAIKAGEAFVRISLEKDELERSLKIVQARLNSFARTASQVGLAIGAFGALGAAGLAKAVSAANDVELTGRRLDAVFRDGADSARDFAAALAVDIGESRFALEKTLTTFKSFFAEIIEGDRLQTQFSEKLTRLSRDFAAFQGLDSTDALQRFISALSGSPEVLDRFGINLKAAALNADLAARGIEGTTATVTEFQKVLSRIRIIESTLGSQGAIGKARQELETFAGAMRAARNAVFDFTVAIGQSLVPVLRPIVATFANLAQGLTVLANNVPALTIAFGGIVAASLALSGALVAAGIAAAALAVTIGAATSIFNSYQAFVAGAGLQTAGFTTVLGAATTQFAGFAAGAVAAGASAIGFGISASTAAAGLTSLRISLAATLATLGKLVAGFVIISTVLGSVPGLSTEAATGILLVSAAVFALRRQFNILIARLGVASEFLKEYSKITSLNLGSRGIIASRSLNNAAKLGIVTELLGKRFKFLGKAVSTVGRILAGITPIIGTLVAAVAVLGLGLVGIGKDFRVGERAAAAYDKVLGQLQARFPALSAFVDEFTENFRGTLDRLGDFFSEWGKLIKEGFEVVKDGFAIVTGGQTTAEKEAAAAERAAEARGDRLLELDRRIQDARIAGIRDTARRRRAALKAEIQREIQDEIDKNKDLESLRERQKEELSGIEGRGARQAKKAEQRAELQEAIANNKAVNKLRQEGAIKQRNLERTIARQVFNERLEFVGRLRRARIEAAEDGAAKELALLVERQQRELAKARQHGEDLNRLAEVQAQERANIISSFNRRLRDEEKSLQDEIAKERIDAIKDEGRRQEAQLRAEFKQRMQGIEEARQAMRELSAVNGGGFNVEGNRTLNDQEFQARRLFEIKLSELRKRLRREEREEEERAAEERRNDLISISDDIASLKIDLSTPEGLDRTLAKIELERKKAIREAGGDEQIIAGLNEKFDLRRQVAQQQTGVREGRATGTFSLIQARAFSASGSGKSREQELLERQQAEMEKQTRIQEEIRDGQGAA